MLAHERRDVQETRGRVVFVYVCTVSGILLAVQRLLGICHKMDVLLNLCSR